MNLGNGFDWKWRLFLIQPSIKAVVNIKSLNSVSFAVRKKNECRFYLNLTTTTKIEEKKTSFIYGISCVCQCCYICWNVRVNLHLREKKEHLLCRWNSHEKNCFQRRFEYVIVSWLLMWFLPTQLLIRLLIVFRFRSHFAMPENCNSAIKIYA